MVLAGAIFVPNIDLGLHLFTRLQQGAILWAQIMHEIA